MGVEGSLPGPGASVPTPRVTSLPDASPKSASLQLASLYLLANPVFTVFWSAVNGPSWDTSGMVGRSPKKRASTFP